ncbi:hypothetical protein [Virgibacillus sp. SK37]|uniref:hypothetical protein n=1 Tax=Virgibacillus sp. SK37 TaxID=403957 RepID=UPI0004D1130E|nr:hypothetical protein [Virgibacillus sp. SK37]AIF45221.1 hypothetical protein X953_05490 [Virgibacillus sp. SK37]
MTQLVASCNDWIGFHLVDDMLDHGYKVNGIEDSAKEDMLTMFFGRNSSFQIVNSETKEYYEHAILTNGNKKLSEVNAEHILVINPGENRSRGSKETFIFAPLLYGEWMPMNKQGIIHGKEVIPFDSKRFQQDAIYIKEFTKLLIQCMKVKELSPNLYVKTKEMTKREKEKLENSIYIRDNIPKKKRIEQVMKHYEQFKSMYNSKD